MGDRSVPSPSPVLSVVRLEPPPAADSDAAAKVAPLGPTRLDNLKPWPKGVSGNPNGGPRTKPIRDAYMRLGSMAIADREKLVRKGRFNAFEMIAYRMLCRAERDALNMVAVQAAIEVADRVDGKVQQKVVVAPGREDLDELSDEELTRRLEELRGQG